MYNTWGRVKVKIQRYLQLVVTLLVLHYSHYPKQEGHQLIYRTKNKHEYDYTKSFTQWLITIIKHTLLSELYYAFAILHYVEFCM